MRHHMNEMNRHCTRPEIAMQGPVLDSMSEFAEAEILLALTSGTEVPDFRQMGITASSWILGLCDCLGELRRIVLANLADGDLDEARRYFDIMKEVYDEICTIDVPDSIAVVRRKQDISRGLIDKTLSELTLASIMAIPVRREIH